VAFDADDPCVYLFGLTEGSITRHCQAATAETHSTSSVHGYYILRRQTRSWYLERQHAAQARASWPGHEVVNSIRRQHAAFEGFATALQRLETRYHPPPINLCDVSPTLTARSTNLYFLQDSGLASRPALFFICTGYTLAPRACHAQLKPVPLMRSPAGASRAIHAFSITSSE
jgi:hypothetical protein